MSIPPLETKRLYLRGIELRDAPTYQKHFVDYAVISQLSSAVPWPYPLNGIVDYITNFILPKQGHDNWFWGIFLKTNPQEMIGGVSLWRHGVPEHRGFWLGKEYWGQGIMTEAVAPVMDCAFEQLGFETMVLSNALGNDRSRRVKEKTGARLLGIREAKFVDPNYTQAETWEISKEEWLNFRTNNLSDKEKVP